MQRTVKECKCGALAGAGERRAFFQPGPSLDIGRGERAERLSLVEPAVLPDQPNWPNRPLLIAAGALAGAVLGLLLALIVEILRRPLRSPVQLEGLGLPVVGIVPIIDRGVKHRWWQFFRRQEAELA